MINASVKNYHQATFVGEKLHKDCKTEITFDCENLIIRSFDDNETELSTMLIMIDSALVRDLKALICAIEVSYL